MIDGIGEMNYNTFGSLMKIINYRNYNDIDVYFPEYDWISKNKQYGSFKKGVISCPYERKIYGIGYTGEGRYNVSINRKYTKHYGVWHNMLTRCYDSKYHERQPTYIDCEVSPEWHNFQVFSKWYYDNFYQIEEEAMSLDKDILIKGNKIYSPQTCIFVPQRINNLFTKRDNNRGNLPLGVTYNNKKYITRCKVNGKLKHLGCYDTPEQAFQVYKKI